MRRHVTRYIDHVRSRPEHERVQHAVVWASIFTGIIFVVWLFFFFARIARPSVVVLPAETTPSESTQETVDRILDDEMLFTTEPLDERAETGAAPTADRPNDLDRLLPPVE